MALRGSHLIALAIAGGIAGWMWSGTFIQGGQGRKDVTRDLAGTLAEWLEDYSRAPEVKEDTGATIAEREADRNTGAFRVRVASVQPVERFETLALRGRTEAVSKVEVKTETAGTVRVRPVTKGDVVAAGDLLCEIDLGTRNSGLAQAQAQLEQAQADYDANRRLLQRGFTTRSRVRALKTALDAAKAAVENAQQEMTRTRVVAPVSGRVQDPIAEIGDVLRVGDTCATVVDEDPMLFVTQVSETDVTKLATDKTAKVVILNGGETEGVVTYIAPSADAATRTFRVEVTVPNGEGRIRDGTTAQAFVPLDAVRAFNLNSSWLTLADSGEVGVRTVDEENRVRFTPVRILEQNADGLWVDGLEPGTRVIALGQNFVDVGEEVVPVPVDAKADETAPTPVTTTTVTDTEAKS